MFARYTSLQSLSDLDFDLSRSPKIKCDGSIGLPVYDFLLGINMALFGSFQVIAFQFF